MTLLDEAQDYGEREDLLDTEKVTPRQLGRTILDSNLETMHQEILASRVAGKHD